MKNVFLAALSILLVVSAVNAQTKKEKDIAAIKKMCGCYEVEFNFAETFNYSEEIDYEPSRTKRTGALEWVQVVENEEDKIMLQHLLLVGNPSEQHIIKHWRQDWAFENRDFYMYNGDNNWLYEKKSKDDVAHITLERKRRWSL